MCRVAVEARIFPLLELGARKSRHLESVIERLDTQGYECSVEKVDYEFQRGADEMLRVKIPQNNLPDPEKLNLRGSS